MRPTCFGGSFRIALSLSFYFLSIVVGRIVGRVVGWVVGIVASSFFGRIHQKGPIVVVVRFIGSLVAPLLVFVAHRTARTARILFGFGRRRNRRIPLLVPFRLVHAKPKDPWDISGIDGQRIGYQIAKCHEKQMGKGGAKGGAVHTGRRTGPRSDGRWVVDLRALGAVDFDGARSDFVF